GVASSNALGGVMGTLGVLFLAIALRPLGVRTAGLATLLLAGSYLFAGLARTPLIYTPLATALAGVWALWANGGRAGRALAWIALAATAVLGKEVVLVLAPGLLLGHAVRGDLRGRGLEIAAGLALGLAAWKLDPTGTLDA